MSLIDEIKTKTELASESSEETPSGKYADQTGEFRQSRSEHLVESLKIIWDDWRGKLGVLIIAAYVLMGTVGVVLVPEPIAGEGGALVGLFEDWAFPLGTNNQGQDLFALTVHATPPMLKMVLSGGVFATAVATAMGTVAGYKGGRVDQVLMTITDSAMAVPTLPLVIVIAAIISVSNPYLVGILVVINAWAGLARTIRSQVLTIREESYVEASRVLGVPNRKIITGDVTPQLMPYIAVHFMNLCRTVIFASVGLYFLGVLPYTSANWGVMLNEAYSWGALSQTRYIHWVLVPMATIAIFSLGLIFLAQSSDRVFNPRIRAKHVTTELEEEEEETTAMIR